MNWVRNLLEVVRGPDIALTAELVQESVLPSEHRSRTDDCRFREDATSNLLALALGSVKSRLGVDVGVV